MFCSRFYTLYYEKGGVDMLCVLMEQAGIESVCSGRRSPSAEP
jgi:hypothetical protein